MDECHQEKSWKRISAGYQAFHRSHSSEGVCGCVCPLTHIVPDAEGCIPGPIPMEGGGAAIVSVHKRVTLLVSQMLMSSLNTRAIASCLAFLSVDAFDDDGVGRSWERERTEFIARLHPSEREGRRVALDQLPTSTQQGIFLVAVLQQGIYLVT